MDLKETIAVDCIKQEVNDVPEVESEYSNHSEKDEKIHFEMLPIEKCENQEIGDIVKFKPDCSREIKIEEEEFTSFHLSMPDVKEETQVSPWQTALSVEENSKYKSDHEDIRNNTFSHSDCLNPPHEHRKSNVKVVLADEIVPKESSLSCGKSNSERFTTSDSVVPAQYLECISASSDKNFPQLSKSQTPNRPFQCKICSKSFTRKNDRNRHMIIHTSNRPFQCEICSKSFTQKSYLSIHMITHTAKRPFQCEICNKSFTQKSNLNTHMITHTYNSRFKCEICSKSFSQKSYLSTHVITHISNRSFPCDICSKSFTRKDSLSAHMFTHTGNSPFQCEICNKSFTRTSDLNRHMIIHTSNLPFQCEICSKYFTQKINLSTHMTTHTSNRPFQCEICNKSFTRKSDLSRHMIIHTSNRPFQC
ncbi:hypothetical protein C0J52_19050 [Blattella germanica]|nr:hypothetical protein C0J52_19050 [Blattella germanica]PSN31449.1 hypothetical protein C0J52_19050 [Blattella germanica]